MAGVLGHDRLHILDIPVDGVTSAQTLDMISRFVRERVPQQLVTVNPEFIMAAQENREFRRVLNGAALALPDGVGVLWAARVHGCPLPERVSGSDLVPRIAARAAAQGWRIFLLGAAEDVAEQAAARLHEKHPELAVVGTYSGSPAVAEEAEIVERVRAADPDILLVAYGAPAQDLWIARNLRSLGVPVCMGVGGTFDFIAGIRQRAPRWAQRLGVEWLYRLVQEPWRWRRQLALPRFAATVLAERWQGRRREERMGAIVSAEEARERCEAWQAAGQTVVFTNGHFDVLHLGHAQLLQRARSLGDVLVVGLNSDSSARRLKGPLRPIVPQEERAALLAALACVDLVTIFDDLTADDLVASLRPDVYAKGGDWQPGDGKEGPPEAEVVLGYGGEVHFLPYLGGHSTSDLVQTILDRFATQDSGDHS
ncbi:MAG TPA: WecB/TagA/CpsF family glycosyltransferase [Anaerolineae bacterium]|nr:WecB/TagA/CpsF family glycosyltransferase [Anaerolineae bacterium]